MLLNEAEANRWEEGCRSDVIRNQFVAPNLSRLLDLYRPASILDIGTGTGYVPRIVDSRLSYRPDWTLLDKDVFRLAVAEQLASPAMRSVTVAADVLEHRFAIPFSAALATFTLLEIDDVDRLIGLLPELISDGGLLLLSLPDVWRDVLRHGEKAPSSVSEFLLGSTSVPKIDKFTQESYPFQAVRLEHLISKVLASGFRLFELVESDGDQAGVYILAFQRRENGR